MDINLGEVLISDIFINGDYIPSKEGLLKLVNHNKVEIISNGNQRELLINLDDISQIWEYFVDIEFIEENTKLALTHIENDEIIVCFLINQNSGASLKEFIENYIENKINEFMEDVLYEKVYLALNKDVIELSNNYIKRIGANIFLIPENYYSFELFLSKIDKRSEFQLSYYLTNILVNQNSNVWETFYENSFLLFVKLLNKKVNFADLNVGVFATWMLLREVAIEYYFNAFYEKYLIDFVGFNIEDDFVTIEVCISLFIDVAGVNLISETDISMFVYYLMYNDKFDMKINKNFLSCHTCIKRKFNDILEEKQLAYFEMSLSVEQVEEKVTLERIDLMSGSEFEDFIAVLFRKMGYFVEVTKVSGDQGIDVIAEKGSIRIGIQAKCYTSTVSNKAIQEVYTGLNFYNLNKGIVVTNNYFTDSAKELALVNNIVLWDRDMLERKVFELF